MYIASPDLNIDYTMKYEYFNYHFDMTHNYGMNHEMK